MPLHIPHTYSKQMAEKSSIVPLKLCLLNEAKYEDCVKILDNTQHEIRDYFSQGGRICLSQSLHGSCVIYRLLPRAICNTVHVSMV